MGHTSHKGILYILSLSLSYVGTGGFVETMGFNIRVFQLPLKFQHLTGEFCVGDSGHC